MKVNISLAQININCDNFIENYEKVVNIINSLPLTENHFLLLPELWLTGYSYSNFKNAYIFFKENIKNIQVLAQKKSINIIGSVPWMENNKFFNRCIIINFKGDIAGFYDKIHLFKPLKEHEYFFRGKNPCVIPITDIKFGIMICYDLRFPELARKLIKKNAQLIFIIAEWPYERIQHWILLNKARALENQIFIAACNRVGKSDNILFGGNSLIVNYNGEIIHQMNTEEAVSTQTIELSEIDNIKKLFDIKEDIMLN